ncbi:MAG: hypothetical protein HN403_12480 [Rhodospirillales bacterium]|jgi:predicted transglutaminase-like cysteine proteinase|nr:hypothetical protein [Rhodospirillales bacterium]
MLHPSANVPKILLFLLVAVVVAWVPRAATADHGAAERLVPPPKGFIDFCRRHPGECTSVGKAPAVIGFSPARFDQISDINRKTNLNISYRADSYTFGRLEFWEYPFVYGDCEDYALLKKRQLTKLGFHPSSLLLATVRTQNVGLHVVLLVLTSDGTWVLDNRNPSVVRPQATTYEWLSRQSRFNPANWVAMDSVHSHRMPGAATATGGN